jgi:hypothetical protein
VQLSPWTLQVGDPDSRLLEALPVRSLLSEWIVGTRNDSLKTHATNPMNPGANAPDARRNVPPARSGGNSGAPRPFVRGIVRGKCCHGVARCGCVEFTRVREKLIAYPVVCRQIIRDPALAANEIRDANFGSLVVCEGIIGIPCDDHKRNRCIARMRNRNVKQGPGDPGVDAGVSVPSTGRGPRGFALKIGCTFQRFCVESCDFLTSAWPRLPAGPTRFGVSMHGPNMPDLEPRSG